MENLLVVLQNRLAECPTRDRAGLVHRLRGLRRRLREGKPVDRGLEQLTRELEAAANRLKERRAQLPIPTFDNALPINAHRETIAAAIRDHQ
ncbi:MAG: hypothetical protein KDI73_10380, partial [Candidatus Competibacteraceae bacterium]|nr:hypothetical protein [Candidatus Competibacteraceae bacterium]